MTKFMIVMLIWAGDGRGGPTTIQGFETIVACEAAVQIVQNRMPSAWQGHFRQVCVELPVG